VRVTQISIELEKRVNDADYGSEKAIVGLTAALEPGDDPVLALSALQEQARGRVEQDLRRSVNLEVRRRMNPKPRLCGECQEPLPDDETRYLHPACDQLQRERHQREREEREAHWRAEQARELLGDTRPEADAVGDGSAADDDDDLPL